MKEMKQALQMCTCLYIIDSLAHDNKSKCQNENMNRKFWNHDGRNWGGGSFKLRDGLYEQV